MSIVHDIEEGAAPAFDAGSAEQAIEADSPDKTAEDRRPTGGQWVSDADHAAEDPGAMPVDLEDPGSMPVDLENPGSVPVDLENPGAQPMYLQGSGLNPVYQQAKSQVKVKKEGCSPILKYSLIGIVLLAAGVGAYFAFVGFGTDYSQEWNRHLDDLAKNASNKTKGGGRKMALIINVSYKDTQIRYNQKAEKKGEKPESVGLPGTISDGENMCKYLEAQGFDVTWMRDDFRCEGCDDDQLSCRKCRSHTHPVTKVRTHPNARNIRDALRSMASASKPGDVLWLYYSGHGSQQRDRSGSEEDGKDEIIMPADYDQDCDFVSDDWFSGSNFRGSIDKKAETVAIFDCCHSGTMFDLPWTMDVAGDDDKWVRNEAQPDSNDDGFFFYVSGCQDAQTSAEVSTTTRSREGKVVKKSFGALTNTLKRLITDKYFNKSIREFLEELRKIVGQNKNEDGSAQAPNICCTHPFDLNKTTFAKMCDGEVPGIDQESE